MSRFMNVEACKGCLEKNNSRPPCLAAHEKSQAHRPCLLAIEQEHVARPWQFHAAWTELIPLLISGQYTSYDARTEGLLATLTNNLENYMGGGSHKYAYSDSAAEACEYDSRGDFPLYLNRYVIVRAIEGEARYAKFLRDFNIQATPHP